MISYTTYHSLSMQLKNFQTFLLNFLDHCLLKKPKQIFVWMLLSCHVRVSEWIYTLQFAWMSRNSLFEAGTIYLKFNWQQWGSNPQPLSSKRTFHHLESRWCHSNISCFLWNLNIWYISRKKVSSGVSLEIKQHVKKCSV